jgi:hypothetical protein
LWGAESRQLAAISAEMATIVKWVILFMLMDSLIQVSSWQRNVLVVEAHTQIL